MMRSRNSFSSLIGRVVLMAEASAAGTHMLSAPTLRSAYRGKNCALDGPPPQNTELQREISAHNREVTRLKYEKKSLQRQQQPPSNKESNRNE